MCVAFKPPVLVAVMLFFTGCGTTRFTENEREESFRSHEGLMIGGTTIREYVVSRTALLFDAVQFRQMDLPEATNISGDVKFRNESSISTAAAVDRQGYFVTAAHGIDGRDVSLSFLTSTGPRIEKARVVWVGDPTIVGFDFALLHVPSSLEHVFEWAPDFNTGDVVISAGASMKVSSKEPNRQKLEIHIKPVGGRIAKTLDRVADGVEYRVILHQSPVIKGNSGGPLVAKDGRLLAINFGGRSQFPIRWNDKMRFTHAVRTDFDWLASLIARDQNNTIRTRRR
jgi:S1-C subfamily serine protease